MSMSTTSTDSVDQEDMLGLQAGREVCLDRLMERHGGRLFRYLVRVLQDETEAQEVAQETFVRVFLHRARFEVGQRFSGWLYSIATNLGRDVLRRRQTRRSHAVSVMEGAALRTELGGGGEAGGDPHGELARRERGELVREAIGGLAEDLREVVILSEYEGLSHAEIGEVVGCSAKAVEMRLYRGRQVLRERLRPLMGDGAE